ncbi:MAG: group 1 glycosyl transferase [Elusimicrobia bacterium]|nr:MAG: group 1 glycosyl transferase [Elusimicrobiota bacterium]KAF0158444.1 MAG: group 1 glycosyl transferase [Elusimicrobiota bacterium]
MEVTLIHGPCRGSLPVPAAVSTIELPDLGRELSPLRDLRAYAALRRIFRELRPDIIHTHTSKAGFLGRLAAARCGARVVHTPHGHLLYGYYDIPRTSLFLAAEKFAARFTDGFVALTEGEKRETIAAGIGRPEQWTVAHSGVDLPDNPARASRKELGLPAGRLIIGTVARLEPVKGVKYFVKAAGALRKILRPVNPFFLIVGDGAECSRLYGLARSAGIMDDCLFAGFQKDVYSWLSAMDVYVQPSLNEAMGRTVLQAQHMGLPVVASRVCGIPDVVREGETAILVRPGAPEQIAAAAAKLAKNADLRSAMGRAAAAFTREKDAAGRPRFGPEAMNAAIRDFYKSIMG